MSYKRKIGPQIVNMQKQGFTYPDIKKRPYEDKIDLNSMRKKRLKKVREELAKRDYGGCVLFDPINIRYSTDSSNMMIWTMHNPTRYCFIPTDGPVILYDFHKCEHLSEGLITIDEIRPSTNLGYFFSGDNIKEDAKKWATEIVNVFKKYAGNNNRLAIDDCSFLATEALRSSNIELFEGQEILEQARKIKTSEEIMCMQAALKVAEDGINLMKKNLKPGISENELWSYLHKTNIENGGEWIEGRLLSAGQRTNPWMQECSGKIIKKNELVAFDTDMIGPYAYCADVSRTFLAGNKPTTEQNKLYSLAVEQITYNAEILKPGLSYSEFIQTSWKLPQIYFDNRYSCIAHGVGMADEYPAILYPEDAKKNGYDGFFETGMTLSLESYIGETGGKEGVKLEQEYLLTEKGAELLSNQLPNSLLIE